MAPNASAVGGGGRFPTTRWTLILAAREGDEPRRAALEQLLSAYWRPVYFYLRRRGLSVEDAEDAVQGLFAQLVQGDFPLRLDPSRGRFRSYLLTAVDHYLVNLHEKRTALKRGGAVRFVPLDLAPVENELMAAPEEPRLAFEREWALGVMERALFRLGDEYREGRRKGTEAILGFFRLEDAPSYAQAAAASGMTVVQFKAALHRARRRFREILREEVAGTVDGEGQADEELGELLRVLSA
jgi:RNA polymerase sigma factor (sigma-70 family)